MKPTIRNLWQENRTLSMITENQVMKKEIKLPIIRKF